MVKPLALAIFTAFASAQALAAATHFDDFTPLSSSFGTPIPVADAQEATPFILANPAWTQETIADRSTQLGLGHSNSGLWDMIDTNHTGVDAGRYLFMPFEPSNAGGVPNTASGAQRIDLWETDYNKRTITLVPVGTQNWQRGDASRWTPWGGWLTGEENFSAGNASSGRLFEVTNPVSATKDNGNLVQRNSVVPLISHEGIVFDNSKNLYFVDENSSGSIYKFVSANPNAGNGDDYFAAGQTFVAKVNSGQTGAYAWEAITDINGGNVAATARLASGEIDGRASADNAGGTAYSRPEDMEIVTLPNGDELMLFTATGTHEVYSMNLTTRETKLFASRNTVDAATGLAVGNVLASPDNMAIDAAGNFYIIEDQSNGAADIWMATDADKDGVAERLSRWATLGTTGAEPTGLYFDAFNPNVAYVNIQHPSSGIDRTIMITAVPEPETYAMMLAGLGLVGAIARRRA